MKKIDYGYPFGVVQVTNPDLVRVVDACCYADNHFSHPYCHNDGWKEEVEQAGGKVLAGPVYDSWSGWRALVEFPSAGTAFGRLIRPQKGDEKMYEWDLGDAGLFYPEEVFSTTLNCGVTVKGTRRYAVMKEGALDHVEEETALLDVTLLEDADVEKLERLKATTHAEAILELLDRAAWEWWAIR